MPIVTETVLGGLPFASFALQDFVMQVVEVPVN